MDGKWQRMRESRRRTKNEKKRERKDIRYLSNQRAIDKIGNRVLCPKPKERRKKAKITPTMLIKKSSSSLNDRHKTTKIHTLFYRMRCSSRGKDEEVEQKKKR